MKRLLFLVLMVPVFSFTAPKADDAKNNWVYELVKPVIKPAVSSDYMYISGWSPNGCDGYIAWDADTNSVGVARWWRVELWVSGTGYPFYAYNVQVPANTSVFRTASPWVFDCPTTLTGFQAFLL